MTPMQHTTASITTLGPARRSTPDAAADPVTAAVPIDAGAVPITAGIGRRATTAALLAGPLLTAAGMATTPWETDPSTASYQAALAAHPEQGMWAAMLLCFGYALMGLAFLTVLQRSHRAPRPLKVAASVFAFCGATILPGLVVVDFYDLAIAQSLPQDQAVAIAESTQEHIQGALMQIPAVAGALLGSILVVATAWRSGLVGGWAPLLIAASMVVSIAVYSPVAMIAAGLVTIVVYGGIALRLRSVDTAA